jgi:hypothetical protein
VDAFSVRLFLELLKHRQMLNCSTIGRRSIKPGQDGDIALFYGTHGKIEVSLLNGVPLKSSSISLLRQPDLACPQIFLGIVAHYGPTCWRHRAGIRGSRSTACGFPEVIQMTNPSGRASSAIVATIAVGVAVATIQVGAADAAEKCLTTPKAETPSGQHWFYRVEAGSKRHCWYLGDEGKTSSRAPTSTSARRTAPDPAPTGNDVLARSTADARAEMQMPRTLTQNDKDLAAPSGSLTPTVPPDSSAQGATASASTANADRWSEVAALPQSDGAALSAGTPPTALSKEQASEPPTNPDATTETTVTPAANMAAESKNSMVETTPSLIGLISIMLGALILLGLWGSAIYRRAKARAKRRSVRSFGQDPVDAAQSPLDVDDNLRGIRELLVRLKHESQPSTTFTHSIDFD